MIYCKKVHKKGQVFTYSMNIIINCTRLAIQKTKQVALLHSCDLLPIINTYIKHSDSSFVSGKVHKARNPTHQKRTSQQPTIKSSSIKTGRISYLLTPVRISGEDMPAKVVKLFITAVLVRRRQHENEQRRWIRKCDVM